MYTYVRKKEKKKAKENAFLAAAIECIAQKYNIIEKKKKKNKTVPLALYDFENNKPYKKRTIRFIARQATVFIEKIRNAELVTVNATKRASANQIRFLLNDNADYTTVNTVIIMTVIIQLLQYSIDSKEYKALIHVTAKKDDQYAKYNPDWFVKMNNANASSGCAKCFFQTKMGPILNGYSGQSEAQRQLAEYLRACSVQLDHLVSNHAGIAIRIGENGSNHESEERTRDKTILDKIKEFYEISPTDFPSFPHHPHIFDE